MKKKICIVTSAPISCNPRSLKEADALSEIGYEVVVISACHSNKFLSWDLNISRAKPWKSHIVRYDKTFFSPLLLKSYSWLRQKIYRTIARVVLSGKIAERAYCRLYQELLAAAVKEKANLYIGHNPQALPIVCEAAFRVQAKVAFDSEDYHLGEFNDEDKKSIIYRLLDYLLKKYLPQCQYISASSEGVVRQLRRDFPGVQIMAIYNVFPLALREKMDGLQKDKNSRRLSLYWYSQIIGEDRGIQDAILAAGMLSKAVEIHLRGDMTEQTEMHLRALAKECGVEKYLFFHPAIPSDELLSRTAEHDIGLALEHPFCVNRNLTISNKFFFYLLAGLAIAATSTVGQKEGLSRWTNVGFLYPPGDYRALAKGLQSYLNYPELLKSTRMNALKAAEELWNWEKESIKLKEQVKQMLFP